MSEEKSVVQECLNCKSELSKEYLFCPKCGQEIKRDDTIKGFISHFLADYFTFDSKFSRSIIPLITKPGFLTIEYLMGRRVRYILPLRMFIFTSVILFLMISLSGKSSNQFPSDITDPALDYAFWNNFFKSYLPKIFFVLLPIFALLLKLFNRKKSDKFIVEFLFSIHYHTFLFLSLLIYWIISSILEKFHLTQVNLILFGLTLLYSAYYLWRAMKLVYGDSGWITFVKLITLGILYGSILLAVTFMVLYISLN